MARKLSEDFIRNHCITHTDFSPCRTYRYVLSRQWANGEGNLLFIMLNPSTADETANDPTVDKCMNWAIAWGYKSFSVCNLFAYRETDRLAMVKKGQNGFDIVGPNNNEFIIRQAKFANQIILGWGNEGNVFDRGNEVIKRLNQFKLYAMKINANGSPSHPLYLKKSSLPIEHKPNDALAHQE